MSADQRDDLHSGEAYRQTPPLRRRPIDLAASPAWRAWVRPWLWLLVVLVLAYPFYYWYILRVEVYPNELLVLINKTGRAIPADHSDQVVLAPYLVADLAEKLG